MRFSSLNISDFLKRLLPVLISVFLLSMVFTPVMPTSMAGSEDDSGTRAIGDTPMGDWSQLPTGGWPASIDSGSCDIMYREAEEELVVFDDNFGGFNVWSYFASNDTWKLWTTTGTGPAPTYDLRAFTTNFDNDIAMFFGGQSGWTVHNKINIFFYSNKTWIELDPPSSLGGRYGSELFYDEATDSFWVFGGRDGSWTRYSDLHQFNFTNGWNHPTPPSPTPTTRDQGMATMSPDGQHVFIALGRYQSGGGGSRYCTDVWEYNVSANGWTELNDDIGAPTEAGGILQYRADTDDLFLSMGYDGNDVVDNTYIINATTGEVTRVYLSGGISARNIQAWDVMSDGRTLVIFGDNNDARDIWSLDMQTYVSDMMPGNPPWTGGNAFTGFDPDDGGKLLALKYVGGNFWQLAYYSLITKNWNFLDVSDQNTPTYHDGMASAYDPVDKTFYIYGGYYSYRVSQWEYHYYFYDEFWKLDIETGEWTRINEHAQPGPRGRASMVMDAENRHIYLYSGQIAGGDTDTLVRYNITSNIWQSITPTPRPQARTRTSTVFHPEKDGFYMFGGRRNGTSNAYLQDLWFFHADTQMWEQLANQNPPSLQADVGLSINTDTNELMLYGTEDADVMIWRQSWFGWRGVETPNSPGGWSGHGQVYSESSQSHLIWAGEGVQVWEFNPILRTTAVQILMYNPDGQTSTSSPLPVFPSMGVYDLVVNGITDMPNSDLLGLNTNLTVGGREVYLNWTRAGNTLDVSGDIGWFIFPGEVSLEFPKQGEWKVTIPIEFTFRVPQGITVRAKSFPVTDTAFMEFAQRTQLFTMNSELSITSYNFRTPLQSEPKANGWLFGRSNFTDPLDLTVHDFKIAFSDHPDVQPKTGGLKATLENQFGDRGEWEYVYNTSGVVSVPIKGVDRQSVWYYLNLTTTENEVLNSLQFFFKIDLDPPGMVENVKVRADSIEDDVYFTDNDAIVYLTWDGVFENGSGLKGICYSLDDNLWPAEENLTMEFAEIQIIQEGAHKIYVWAVDKTNRVGPYFEGTITIDSHRLRFVDLIPAKQVNVTYTDFVVHLRITDDTSGVDVSSIQVKYSLPSKDLSDWVPMDLNDEPPLPVKVVEDISSGVSNNVTLSVSFDLVPGIDNLISFRANDISDNGYRESPIFIIYCNPNQAMPRASLVEPLEGADMGGETTLTWKGYYINPLNLTYDLHVVDPLGNEEVYPVAGTSYQLDLPHPGVHTWWVVAKADGLSNSSLQRTFINYLDFARVTLPDLVDVTIGYEVAVEVIMKNRIQVPIDVSIALDESKGMSIMDGNELSLEAGESKTFYLVLNTSGVSAGSFKLPLNVSDSYGRYQVFQLQIKAVKEKDDTPVDSDEDEAFPMELLYGIAGAVAALVILAVIVFMILRKKKEEKEREEKEEEEDDDFGISLHYDPKGKVAKGGKHVESSVPLAPGMIHGNEAEMRKRGSNIIEITLPTKEEMEKEEEIPDYREDEMEEETEDYEEDEMEELSPEEMASELYGSSSEE
ncbi:MAG: kelch repeat-containing protein [Thermoplasmatota archaeon]